MIQGVLEENVEHHHQLTLASSHKNEAMQVSWRGGGEVGGGVAFFTTSCFQRSICTLHISDCGQPNPIKPAF